MPNFRWLHLSDWHGGTREHGDYWPELCERFFDDLKALHREAGPWDVVLFTGDLTQSGEAGQFSQLDGFLDLLWEVLEKLGSRPLLLAVPGNHDLERPNDAEMVAVLRAWSGKPQIRDAFLDTADSPPRQLVKDAFRHYQNWWKNRQAAGIHAGLLPGDFSYTFAKGEGKNAVKIGILGLNSAFLQLADGKYQGKLALHTRQFHAACGGNGPAWAKEHHLCLLLTHHPQDWLRPDVRKEVRQFIDTPGRFAAHLFGHRHEASLIHISEGDAPGRNVWQSPSLFGSEYFQDAAGGSQQRLFGYSAGRLAITGQDSAELTFWPRIAEPHQAGPLVFRADHAVVYENTIHTRPVAVKLNRHFAGHIEQASLAPTSVATGNSPANSKTNVQINTISGGNVTGNQFIVEQNNTAK